DDTVSIVNSWTNDTVHIESDTAEFFVQYPSVYTSIKGFAHLKVEGGSVTFSQDSGVFDGILPALGDTIIHFFLDDSLKFHYNLDTVVPHNPNIPLKVKISMYGNSINNFVSAIDTIVIAPLLISAPTCFAANNGAI